MPFDSAKKFHYRCVKCKYMFSRNNPAVKCPYCGSDSVQKDTQDMAERLIEESERMF